MDHRRCGDTLVVRDLAIGAGRPKICVPLTGRTEEEILAELSAPGLSPADLVEWRADYYDHVSEPASVLHMLRIIRESLGDRPLLFTFRTQAEGGEAAITADAYERLLTDAAASGLIDLADLELFAGDTLSSEGEAFCRRLTDNLHTAGVPVVMSSHDFAGTPALEELLRRLRRMQDLGADILKIAVMPRTDANVLTLLTATQQMRDGGARRPLITMAMADRGVVSRVAGGFFGSAVTFGSAARASAPGQMEAGRLRTLVDLLYENR